MGGFYEFYGTEMSYLTIRVVRKDTRPIIVFLVFAAFIKLK